MQDEKKLHDTMMATMVPDKMKDGLTSHANCCICFYGNPGTGLRNKILARHEVKCHKTWRGLYVSIVTYYVEQILSRSL